MRRTGAGNRERNGWPRTSGMTIMTCSTDRLAWRLREATSMVSVNGRPHERALPDEFIAKGSIRES